MIYGFKDIINIYSHSEIKIMTKRQAQYLADRLLMLGEGLKSEAWSEIRKGFAGFTEEYIEAVWICEQVRIYKAGIELEIPSEWRSKYREIIKELETLNLEKI